MRKGYVMKRLSLILASLLVILSAGCTKTAPDKLPDGTAGTTAAVTEPSTQETTEAPVTDEPAGKSGLYIFNETITDGGALTTVSYPFYGDGEHDAFDVAMRNYAMHKYTASGAIPGDGAVYEITDFDITLETENFVSAVVRGRIFSPGAAHDTIVAYTINADTRTGKVYTSDELIGDLDALKDGFTGGRFQQNMGLTDVLSEITAEDIVQSWRSDYGVFPNVFFTEKSFGVLPELAYAIGGYAGFVIPYADAGEMLNDTAKGLCGVDR